MSAEDVLPAGAGVFIAGMIWLRTRMVYARERRGPLERTREGTVYLSSVLAVLLILWFAAPVIFRLVWPESRVSAAVPRVIAFLLAYYLFIPAHKLLRARGLQVYRFPQG